jgi:hypothetical protein
MKILSNSGLIEEMWKSEGSTVAESISEDGIQLIHIGGRETVDSFFLGYPMASEGSVLENMKALLAIRYGLRNGIPVIASGSSSKLLTSCLGHSVDLAAKQSLNLVGVAQNCFSLDKEDLDYLSEYGEFSVKMDNSYSLQRVANHVNLANNYLVNQVTRTVHSLVFPRFKALAYQPDPELEQEKSTGRDFFFDTVELLLGDE